MDNLKPYPGEHAARLKSPDKYDEFRRKNNEFGNGIDAIYGIYTEEGKRKSELQAIRFDAKIFTVSQAKAWLKEHDYKPIEFEQATREKKINVKNYKSKLKDLDEKEGIVTIYVSAFGNKDADGDIVQKGAYTKTINENLKRIRHLKDHNPFQLLGLPLEMIQDDHGLLVRSAMNMSKSIAKDALSDYLFFSQHDRTIEHSIGYNIPKDKQFFDEKKEANIITEVKLLEYSTLSFLGSNSETPFIDAKYLELMYDYPYSDERLNKIENILKSLVKKIEPCNALNEKDKSNFYNYLINNI